jgi:predicted ATP-binding protein involved in virulence
MLEPRSVRLERKGLTLKGPWGTFQPLGGLGNGYQATLAWISDLMGCTLLQSEGRLRKSVSSIVIVDELEQHLHPRWQRSIIALLSKQFPRVQFVVTTHTPMCALGTTDLQDRECSIIILKRELDQVNAYIERKPPQNQWADQILTSPLFDVVSIGDDSLFEAVNRYHLLVTKKHPTRNEQREIKSLLEFLRTKVGGARTKLEQVVQDHVTIALTKERDKAIDISSAKFEVLRQMRSAKPND